MSRSRFVRQSFLILCSVIIVSFANISLSSEYEPYVGQEGKDVIWVPTCQVLVDQMLNMAKVTSEDYLIDLGSGDGRLVITAAKRGARALGIEYNPDMVDLSRQNAAKEGVSDKAQFVQADIFASDFSQATVITMFLLESINRKLRPKILDLKPGTRIVSNTFTMGEWKADQTFDVDDPRNCSNYSTAYLWIVPAKVEGVWSLPQGSLALNQTFQTFSGTLKSGVNLLAVTDGKLNGDLIRFSVGNDRYNGRVSGNTMEGTYESGRRTIPWRATKLGKGS
ncbi:MAG: class I SAM-dependent methyltransferase [Thermodesulfobacteriota bacterium]